MGKTKVEKLPEKKVWNLENGFVVVDAFYDGVEWCYQMQNIFNMPCLRALDGIDVYSKLDSRCDKKYLETFYTALNSATANGQNIDVDALFKLKFQLRERLDFAMPPEELLWQFAAIAFFDQHESPYKYDDIYGQRKIQRWKQKYSFNDFFLTTPISSLIPLPGQSEIDLNNYLKMQAMVESKQMKELYNIIQ